MVSMMGEEEAMEEGDAVVKLMTSEEEARDSVSVEVIKQYLISLRFELYCLSQLVRAAISEMRGNSTYYFPLLLPNENCTDLFGANASDAAAAAAEYNITCLGHAPVLTHQVRIASQLFEEKFFQGFIFLIGEFSALHRNSECKVSLSPLWSRMAQMSFQLPYLTVPSGSLAHF